MKDTLTVKKFVSIITFFFFLITFLKPTLGQVNKQPELSTYIIVFTDGVNARQQALELAATHGLKHEFTYETAIKGMSAKVPAARLNGLRNDPRVAYIEKDQEVSIYAQTTPTGVRRVFADQNTNLTINGVDDLRIDVDVAVIDTGVDENHTDINLYKRANCATGGPFNNTCKDNDGTDGNGHGTHVAGTIGALDNGIGVVGVAPGARIWSVRVLDNSGSGYMSWIVAGIDWVTKNAAQIEVANMSLGCECYSAAMNTAISNSVKAGVTYVVAAGNSDKDASTFSPANHPEVITVSALADFNGEPGGGAAPTCRNDQDDTLADFSNWGSMVEIAAPGVCILSTWKDGGYNTISGTSMASPHVAGAAAVLAASGNYTPAQIEIELEKNGNSNWTDDSGDGFKEPLLDVSNTTVFKPATVSGSGTGGGSENIKPVADFTYSVSGSTVNFTDISTDSDGSVVSWIWTFGDGNSSTLQHPSHTYSSSGTYSVSLTVTDDKGATDSVNKSVTVSDSTSGIVLSVTGYKLKGVQHADLTWSGATSTNIDIYRDGGLVWTTANDGSETDNINKKGGGSYVYQVCGAGGTSLCSNLFTVSF